MPFPDQSTGILPWMNQRTSGRPTSGARTFSYGAPIVFRWIEDPTWAVPPRLDPKPVTFVIYANGSYTNVGAVDHYPWVQILQSNPASPTYTVASRSALYAITPTQVGQSALVTSDNSYWWALNDKLNSPNRPIIWVPVRIKTPAGTTSAFGVTNAEVYTCTVPVDDLPKPGGKERVSGGYYELCWNGNSMHSPDYDGNLIILPAGYDLHKDIFDRTELNSRVAGEKALFEDEFITASQVEAGTGITLKWRKLDGTLAGYTQQTDRGGNLVIEANAQAVTVEGAKTNAGIYYTGSIGTIQFRDKPMLVVEPNDTQIPIHSNVYTDDDGKTVVMQHAVHNNLYASRYDILGNITYPMDIAGFDQQTIHHLRFNDSLDVSWSLTGVRIPTNTPEGTVYRKGIAISANVNFPVAYTWNITDADNISPTTGVMTSNDTLTVDGVDGVTATVSVTSATDIKLTVSRPVYAQSNGTDVGNGSTLRFNFEDNWTETGRTPVRFDVVDTGFGVRRIRGSVPELIGSVRDFKGNLSTVWGLNTDTNGIIQDLQFGYGLGGAIRVGPWGFQNGDLTDDPLAGTVTDANWDDDQFVYPNKGGRLNTTHAYSKYAECKKTGLYLVSSTTHGTKFLTAACAEMVVPQFNAALQLFLVRQPANFTNLGYIHKSLDICRFEHMIVPTNNFTNNAGAIYPWWNSKSWSLQGTSLVWLYQGDQIGHMISYANEGGEQRLYFQVSYHACEITLIADESELSRNYAKPDHKLAGQTIPEWQQLRFNLT